VAIRAGAASFRRDPAAALGFDLCLGVAPDQNHGHAHPLVGSACVAIQLVCGGMGRPAQAFTRPRVSRTTERTSRVFRHQWSASNGSAWAA